MRLCVDLLTPCIYLDSRFPISFIVICLHFEFLVTQMSSNGSGSLRCSITADAAGVSASDARQSAITVSWATPASESISVLTELVLLNEMSTDERNQRIASAIDRASQHFSPDLIPPPAALLLTTSTDNASCFVQHRESHTAPSRAIETNLES